ncbi:hypothetical protein B0H14DRAFT_2762350 [Mycena olivaceomarginata]|nr:hypothetical protein B0H14DRAFT_2762350 [Mycena olivaceomarginata]
MREAKKPFKSAPRQVMPCLDRLAIFYGLLAIVPSIHGQTTQTTQRFEWWFSGDQALSTSKPSCGSFSIGADARTADGIPPFYMTAFAVGGTPSTSFIGTNESNLTWTLTHPVGTQLVLGVVDSQGHSGGIAPTLYTVTAGATTQCIPTIKSDTSFKISANVTDVLNTCQPWGLMIEGGAPPYNVTIAPMNSANITNATLGSTDSVFTYINRVPRGASDMNGNWATGSPFVRTQGSADITCLGLVSTGHDAQPANGTPPKHSLSRRAKIGIAVGAAAGAFLLCVVIISGIVRRRRIQRAKPQTTNITPFFAGDGRTDPPLVGFASNASHSRNTSKAGSRQTSETDPESPPPRSATLPVVRELPPPYPNFLRYEA